MSYNAENIQVLEGLEGIRTRPGMYIGNTGTEGLHQCFIESLTNSIDEAMAGFGDTINITIDEDGDKDRFTILDRGRGIPVDIHPVVNKPVLEVLLTHVHAGGKLTADTNYKTSGGNYGVGLKVLNALSDNMTVEAWKNGHHYKQTFAKGFKTSEIEKLEKTTSTGTLMSWTPDPSIFEVLKFTPGRIRQILKDDSFLNPGVKFVLNYKGTKDTYVSKSGLLDMLKDMLGDTETLIKPITIEGDGDNKEKLEIVFTYTNGHDLLRSYANNLKLLNDGTHVTGFRTGFTKAVNSFARENKLLKEKDENISGNELKDGLVAIVSIKLIDPVFENQTKTKLNNAYLTNYVGSVVYNKLLDFFRRYPSIGNAVVKKALQYRRLREAIAKTKETILGTKEVKKFAPLLGKLSGCSSKKPEECELYIIEGESAKTTVKTARDPKTQAVFILKGKVLNTEGMPLQDVLMNAEFRELIQALDCGMGDDLNLSKLRYHKVVIATDADPDGSDIRLGMLTFFVNHMPELLLNGHVYFAESPLFKILHKNKTIYCKDQKALDAAVAKLKGEYKVKRFKGLGEMDASDFKEVVMKKNSGSLVRIKVNDFERLKEVVSKLRGKDSEPRKIFIEKGEI